MEYEQIVLDNSPIQFVLVGPFGGHDKILLRSKDAGLELIGIASSKQFPDRSIIYPKPIISFFSKSVYQLNVVESTKVSDILPNLDDRYSSFRLAWKGFCTPTGRERIKMSLDHSIIDLLEGIKDKNKSDIEFNFSAIILECLLMNESISSRRRLYLWSFIFVVILYIGIGIYAYFNSRF